MLLSAGGVWFAYRTFLGSAIDRDEIIYITSQDLEQKGYEQVIENQVKSLISNHPAFDAYAKRLNLSQRIKPGRYELREGMSVMDIVKMLKIGVQSPIDLTFNNIRTVEQLAGKVAAQIESDSITTLAAFGSKELLDRVGLKSREALLSIFIPNTYEVFWDITPQELVMKMSRESDRFWNSSRESKRKALGLSRMEVMSLASIVYEESAKEDEMPRIAGVYINRIKRGMLLQADPTVRYAVGDFELRRILFKHLKVDSPYNTYKYKGVPPTPIAMPSIAAIDAVLNYERHKYLFFCARPELDGYHNFAKTLREHNANGRAYSREMDRRRL